ncbi:uncharacterized protein LOC111254822 [Varroa destructor]|uniref:Uncharacterized protein n=1 Tax=Varroa destructor TaxID=109461 RepID=A0A7M7L6W6_VARDE|nr:uncharacterized protein LOC111254822 [Varroa destructor]
MPSVSSHILSLHFDKPGISRLLPRRGLNYASRFMKFVLSSETLLQAFPYMEETRHHPRIWLAMGKLQKSQAACFESPNSENPGTCHVPEECGLEYKLCCLQ